MQNWHVNHESKSTYSHSPRPFISFRQTGLVELAKTLVTAKVEILSTGGTARLLRDGLDVIDVADLTEFPEIMGGRVKTLHPKIHGGLLARRDVDDHLGEIQHGIHPIDLLVVNLYPFEDNFPNQ